MNWIKSHPYQAVCFTGYFAILASFAGFLPQFWVQFLVLFFLGLALFVALFYIYKPLLVVLLAALLAIPAPQAKAVQRKGGEVLVGVIVICGASYCIYRLARFCKNHFPPPNTNDVNEAESPFGTNQILGASFVLASDPCAAESGLGTNATTFTINAMVQNGELRTAVSTSGDSSSMEEFLAGMQAQGLALGESYSVDGKPASSSSVPISFQPTTGTISNGIAGTAFLITVQASSDLQSWQQLFTTTASEGTVFQIVDTVVAPSTFYKLILQR